MLNLASFVRESALYYGDKVAVRMGELSFTYQQLDHMSGQVAQFLVDKGIKPGDKVALSCPNLPYFPIVYYGILKAGGVVAPFNVLLKHEEIEYLLGDCEAKAYFVFEGTAELPMAQEASQAFDKVECCESLIVLTADPKSPSPIEGAMTLGQVLAGNSPLKELTYTEPMDTAVILYTSGTTGKAKGAELTHYNMVMNAIVAADIVTDDNFRPHNHTFMLVLPLFHSFGQTVGMNAMFYSGAEITMIPRFDPKQTIEVMLGHKVTVFAGVPTMYWALLNEGKNLPAEKITQIREHLKFSVSGGAALPVEIIRNFDEVFGVEILEGYGLSETSPIACFHQKGRKRKPGSIGQPVWGVEMRIVDSEDKEVPVGEVGEVVIRGHNIMKGYYKKPEATEQAMRNRWFHSGDMGKRDEDNYFYIVDRVKDMVIRGGFNVYPREIEEVLITHPAVSLAAVIGIPHEQHGEEIKAFVVLEEGKETTSEKIVSWCKEKMAAYKYPRIVSIRDSLPMNATGKVLKRELRTIED